MAHGAASLELPKQCAGNSVEECPSPEVVTPFIISRRGATKSWRSLEVLELSRASRIFTGRKHLNLKEIAKQCQVYFIKALTEGYCPLKTCNSYTRVSTILDSTREVTSINV